MRLLLAANNQATRRNEITKSYLQLGSSSNRYAPRLPQQETKSSTKQLPPTDPILGPENLLKTGLECCIKPQPENRQLCISYKPYYTPYGPTREAPTPSPKIISISGTKNEPKTNPLYLLVLVMTIFPFLFCWWKRSRVSKACNRGASRLCEAWPRPRLGRKTYWHKDIATLTGTRNYIILLLKSQQG